MATIFPNPKLHSRASRMLRLVLQALAALLVSVLVGIAASPAKAHLPAPTAGTAPGNREAGRGRLSEPIRTAPSRLPEQARIAMAERRR